MKSFIFLLIMIGLVLGGGSQIEPDDATWFFLIIPAFLLALWMIGCMLAATDAHLTDLATVHSGTKRIKAAEENLEEIKNLAQDGKHGLPESLLALQQDNNPVTTYMAQVRNALNAVNSEKDRKAEAEARIASRAIGPFNFVIPLFGRSV